MGKRRRVGVLGISVFAIAAAVNLAAVTAWANSGNGQAASHASTAQTGSPTQPQPYSNADQNNTGANNTSPDNPYKSTRDGSPSMNGSGNGAATGKPCAGCVGKADNKYPAGHAPNGTDRNAGYECDRNQGIGQTNPAHTGCTTATTTTGPTTTTATGPTTTTATGPTTTVATGPTTTTATGLQQNTPPTTTGTQTGTQVSSNSHPASAGAPQLPGNGPSAASTGAAAAAPAASGTNAPTGSLAFTGRDWVALLALAAILIGFGLFMTTLAGPRRHGTHFRTGRPGA